MLNFRPIATWKFYSNAWPILRITIFGNTFNNSNAYFQKFRWAETIRVQMGRVFWKRVKMGKGVFGTGWNRKGVLGVGSKGLVQTGMDCFGLHPKGPAKVHGICIVLLESAFIFSWGNWAFCRECQNRLHVQKCTLHGEVYMYSFTFCWLADAWSPILDSFAHSEVTMWG